ncbi:bidirectional sugar transporter SWEET10-like [Raphanus sativus]|uniref:Bidirectional sugar transporter SWEET10-like n=1 Tax=Raphanus sativus TaxID=3726 RepID=A0A9W3DFX8_RAPSA|nr:bidirectional sugar transporter SWEET10-like [Raphanus sativus]
MLWIYYAMVKKNLVIMITINTFSLVIQIFYISFYLFYSSMKQKTLTIKLVVLVDVLAFALVFFPTHFLLDGKKRVQFLGYICMIFSLCVFIAPLAMIRRVVKTKTSEFMSFSLSFFLTLSAVTWFVYGVLLKDLNIALPNVLGFIFGWVQMVVYWVYKKPGTKPPGNVQEIDAEHVVDVVRDGDTIIIDENIKGDTEQMMESI